MNREIGSWEKSIVLLWLVMNSVTLLSGFFITVHILYCGSTELGEFHPISLERNFYYRADGDASGGLRCIGRDKLH